MNLLDVGIEAPIPIASLYLAISVFSIKTHCYVVAMCNMILLIPLTTRLETRLHNALNLIIHYSALLISLQELSDIIIRFDQPSNCMGINWIDRKDPALELVDYTDPTYNCCVVVVSKWMEVKVVKNTISSVTERAVSYQLSNGKRQDHLKLVFLMRHQFILHTVTNISPSKL